jgi:hypothetical protein
MVFRTSAFIRFLIAACLSVWLLTAACFPTTPTITPLITPTCVPPATLAANPYLSQPITDNVHAIYNTSVNDLGRARQEALFQLGQNMEHWSYQVDIVNDNAHAVRMTVTYLDPALIQFIVLNQLINDPNYSGASSSSPINESSFDFKLNNTVQQLGARNELLFVVTITSKFYDRQNYTGSDLTVNLPIQQMKLSSTAAMQVEPTHIDGILSESMDIHHGPVSGIVGYPIALLNDIQCDLVIDQFTNTLTLNIPLVTLGGISSGKKFWSIPYRSLVMQTDIYPTPTSDPNILSNPVTQIDEPPIPNWPNNQENATYWEGMGQYLWSVVISESHH